MDNMGKKLQNEMIQRNWNVQYRNLIGEAVKDPEVKRFLDEHNEEIDLNNIERSAARIYEFVQEKNKVANGISSFAKGYVPQLTIINHNVDVVYVPSQETKAKQSKLKFKENFELIDLPADIRNARLDDFPNRSVEFRMDAFKAANKFLINYLKKDVFAPGLYLSGNFGVGKTYLLGAIANELVQQNVEVSLVHFPTFAVKMKSAIGDNSVMAKLDKLKAVPVLMLDDIGADSVSSWIRDEVLGVILQYRMQEELPTFFSSNFLMEDLEKHLAVTRNAEEPIKAQRIMERIKFLSREIIVGGENQRLKSQIEY